MTLRDALIMDIDRRGVRRGTRDYVIRPTRGGFAWESRTAYYSDATWEWGAGRDPTPDDILADDWEVAP